MAPRSSIHWTKKLGLGAGASVNHVPAPFDAEYGGEWPYGFVVFVSARPAPMRMAGMHGHR